MARVPLARKPRCFLNEVFKEVEATFDSADEKVLPGASHDQVWCDASVRGWPKAAELSDATGRQQSGVHRTCCQRSRNGSP